MAFWGTDLTESDQFCEVYDDYMDLYDIGESPSEITTYLFEKYCSLYGSAASIPHNIYFAIAKAEWMIKAQSEFILAKVREIVNSETNIEYYRTLGFSETELDERRIKLTNFIRKLQTPRKSVRKRKISAYNRIKRLPKGAVSWYESDGQYYGFVVLDAVYEGRLIALTQKRSSPPKNKDEVLNAPVLTAIWLLLRNSPKGNHDFDRIEITDNYNGRAGVFICKPISFGLNFTFNIDECHQRVFFEFPKKTVKDLLCKEAIAIKFLCEQTADEEEKMVRELMEDVASKFAKDKIQKALKGSGIFQ